MHDRVLMTVTAVVVTERNDNHMGEGEKAMRMRMMRKMTTKK